MDFFFKLCFGVTLWIYAQGGWPESSGQMESEEELRALSSTPRLPAQLPAGHPTSGGLRGALPADVNVSSLKENHPCLGSEAI